MGLCGDGGNVLVYCISGHGKCRRLTSCVKLGGSLSLIVNPIRVWPKSHD